MQWFNKLRKALSAGVLSLMAVFGGFMASMSTAQAALPKSVTDALDLAKTDGVTAAGMVLAVIVAIVAFKYIRRAL